jgi:aldose 1-epimerase
MITHMKKAFPLLLLSALATGCKDIEQMLKTQNQKTTPVSKNYEYPHFPAEAAFTDTVDGKNVKLFTLTNANGIKVALSNYGARVIGFWMPDAKGLMTDIVLGMPDIKSYRQPGAKFFGSIAGRYCNRIAKGIFNLDGVNYQLDLNNGPNSLHGGTTGFHSRVWEGTQQGEQQVVFSYLSADGEEGYPGNMIIKVTYRLTDANELFMEYAATSDKRTVINVTNHNFWNLNGEGSGTINDHELTIAASRFTPVDSTLIPTGIVSVVATPFDFMQPMTIGKRVGDTSSEQIRFGGGYDHNFVLDTVSKGTPVFAARVKGNKSGIVMDVYTTEPGLQFYGGNFMKGEQKLKSGAKDDYRTAFCVETQHFPNSPNQPDFPSTVLEPNTKFVSVTMHRFTVESEK